MVANGLLKKLDLNYNQRNAGKLLKLQFMDIIDVFPFQLSQILHRTVNYQESSHQPEKHKTSVGQRDRSLFSSTRKIHKTSVALLTTDSTARYDIISEFAPYKVRNSG